MPAANAPMPLQNQVKAGATIVVTVPLRGLGPAPGFTDGGAAFNVGDPTATFTITLPPAGVAINNSIRDLLQQLDDLAQNNFAVIT